MSGANQPTRANGRPRVPVDTLTDRVYRDLSELFMSGQLCPDDRLSLRTLAEQLGTSAMPVREALRQLAAVGAVEISPQRAARVPIMTLSRFQELLRIRLLLEGLAVEQASQRMSEQGLRDARRHEQAFKAEIHKEKPNRATLVQRNKQLHFAIYRLAGSPVLLSLIERLWLLVGPVINYDLRQSSSNLLERPALRHHKSLVDALELRDASAACAALVDDLVCAADLIIATGQLVDDSMPLRPAVAPQRSARVRP